MRHAAIRAALILAAVGSGAGAWWLHGQAREPTDAEIRSALVAATRTALAGDRASAALRAAVAADDPAAADDLLAAADFAGVAVPEELRAEAAALAAPMAAARREALDAVSCRPGNGSGVARFASDLAGLGDVRDVVCEAGNAVAGAEVDAVALGLAAAGIALAVGTVLTAGAASPAKAGTAVLKTAHRADALTAPFRRTLADVARRTLDADGLADVVRRADVRRPDRLAGDLLAHARRIDPAEIGRMAESADGIRRGSGSLAGTLTVLRHVETADDLRRAERVATVAGRPTAGLFRLHGWAAFGALGLVAARAVEAALLAAAAVAALVAGVFASLLAAAAGAALRSLAGLVAPRTARRG
jgi:hypothetical protein